MKRKRYGLIGEKLGHSYSPRIHAELGSYDYKLYELPPERLGEFLASPDIGGLNVTIPYKRDVIPFCSEISEAAKAIGSVNTLLMRDNGVFGHNTDHEGFVYLARRSGIDFEGKKVLILGSGGTSRTVRYASERLGAKDVVVVSRSGNDNYKNLSRHKDAQIIVNTTPVGMYPKNGVSLVSPEQFPDCCGVLDVIYNPLRPRLVQQAQQLGIPAGGGLPMLVRQAIAAAELFTGKSIDPGITEGIIKKLTAEVENIVLVGMPGCGKSTIGRELSRISGRELIDTDSLIESAAGMSIPEIFAREGEPGFRDREQQAVAEAGKRSGVIIATGGGAVLREENRLSLSQNGRVYFITRDLALLATDGRPLSKDLEAMYEKRLPIYRMACDEEVSNSGAPQDVAEMIWARFKD